MPLRGPEEAEHVSSGPKRSQKGDSELKVKTVGGQGENLCGRSFPPTPPFPQGSRKNSREEDYTRPSGLFKDRSSNNGPDGMADGWAEDRPSWAQLGTRERWSRKENTENMTTIRSKMGKKQDTEKMNNWDQHSCSKKVNGSASETSSVPFYPPQGLEV